MHSSKAAAGRKAIFRQRPPLRLAFHARQVMEIPAKRNFDLVISDLGLPDMTGHELMKGLRERGLEGIALSGLGMDQDRTRSLEAGFRLTWPSR
jgi:CheY-like chemotaxis protein